MVALAERHELDTIATLDHRHFATVKPRHALGFTLVPQLDLLNELWTRNEVSEEDAMALAVEAQHSSRRD